MSSDYEENDAVLRSTPKIGRRSMVLADVHPKYVSQNGILEVSERGTPKGGSIKIQHLTAGSRPSSTTSGYSFHGHQPIIRGQGGPGSRFPKLEECAHFHYDIVELPQLKFTVREDHAHRCTADTDEELVDDATKFPANKQLNFSIEVSSGEQYWLFRRTLTNWINIDEQIHKCTWARTFSRLENLKDAFSKECVHTDEYKDVIERYLCRLTALPANTITCGTVLSWFEIDNRGRHIISSDDAALNTPAVAAALAIKTYDAQAPDELSFKVGEMISVIDLPPNGESMWLRGKLTRESQETGINFEVGFFPRNFVEVIGEKAKLNSGLLTSAQTARRVARVSITSISLPIPNKPVLRKHGKIISFFRSMMSRPEKRVLQQRGILRERVFSCDLSEHLLNTGNEVPMILKTCSTYIEVHGICDGIYRISGSLRNTQRLRRLFDADEVPNLEEDEGIRQDVHAASSVVKQYFRELPNPLCTYQLYDKFVQAINTLSVKERFENIKEVIRELPPPHYRTLQYLMLHLSRMTVYSDHTGMTAQNMAIVWAPNLIRSRDLEGGNAAEFKGVSNHVIVTEFLIRYAEMFFGDDKSPLPASWGNSGLGRPKSLLVPSISPMKLMSLEEAQEKLNPNRGYIEVGVGPSSIPLGYHTVIDTSKRRPTLKTKGTPASASVWKNFFGRNRSFSKGPRKTTAADIRVVVNSAKNLKDGTVPGFGHKLRPVRSEESLVCTPYDDTASAGYTRLENTIEVDESSNGDETLQTASRNVVDDTEDFTFNAHCLHALPDTSASDSDNTRKPSDISKTHNRSISHDSYFEGTMKALGIIHAEIHEEDDRQTNSKSSLNSIRPIEDTVQKHKPLGLYERRDSDAGDVTKISPHSSKNSTNVSQDENTEPSFTNPSYDPKSENSPIYDNFPTLHLVCVKVDGDSNSVPSSPVHRPKAKPRLSKLKDSQKPTVNTVDIHTNYGNSSQSGSGTVKDVFQDAELSRVNTLHCPELSESIEREEPFNELGSNSSVDESSSDTTPEAAPRSLTNIIYSPLFNEGSDTRSSSCSLSEEPQSERQRHPSSTSDPNVLTSNAQVHELDTYEVRCSSSPLGDNILTLDVSHESSAVTMENIPNVNDNAPMGSRNSILSIQTQSIEVRDEFSEAQACSSVYSVVTGGIQSDEYDVMQIQIPINEQCKLDNTVENSRPSDSDDVGTLKHEQSIETGLDESQEVESYESTVISDYESSAVLGESKETTMGARESIAQDTETKSGVLANNSEDVPKLSPTKQSLLSRCNSAPLNDTGHEFALTVVPKHGSVKSSENPNSLNTEKSCKIVDSPISPSEREEQKSLLYKRHSEPSLNSGKNQCDKVTTSNRTDAKHLLNRKQSVRELLDKFESSATRTQEVVSLSQGPPILTATVRDNNAGAGCANPGKLPRPAPRVSNKCSEANVAVKDRPNTRYQHHRFSLGDVLVSGSSGSSNPEQVNTKPASTMTRADTYPELRNDSTKEVEFNKEGKDTVSVPKNISHLFEVANATVDNNDPNTRDRIEKYKENRRVFLRGKYCGVSRDQSEPLSSPGSVSTTTGCNSTHPVVLVPLDAQSSSTVERSSSDSLRKRSSSENSSTNQFKSFKAEELSSTPITGNTARRKMEFFATNSSNTPNAYSASSKTSDASNARLNIKSCPPGSFPSRVVSVNTPSNVVGVPLSTKCHWSSVPSFGSSPVLGGMESGRKIQNIAAFFERKF